MYREDRFDRVNEFIDFCEKQPANKSYDWANADICACAQFFGRHSASDWFKDNGEVARTTGLNLNHIAGTGKWKFGPLAKRVRAKLEVA